ncbi:hypothetical protein F511_00517 [Dorcoceras hygrometricum]|uniref:Uncharacterized protein n=1 Tax=Dorcoceras hygrometricum TaxID=472368 RepID=A0A2Z7BB40_9LAMI|nr:hypothetical protein F511_00517 [Dorcoceras hygrometricum]
MDELPLLPSPMPRCCLLKSPKTKKFDFESGNHRLISEKNVYFGDYGMEENIYGEDGIFPVKEQKRLMKEALKKQETSTINKGLKFFRLKDKGKW